MAKKATPKYTNIVSKVKIDTKDYIQQVAEGNNRTISQQVRDVLEKAIENGTI